MVYASFTKKTDIDGSSIQYLTTMAEKPSILQI